MKVAGWLSFMCSWLGAGGLAVGQGVLQPLRINGPTTNHINVVFLSEGYTTDQMPQFEVDAKNALDQLFAIPPWNGYTNYFNAYAIEVASAESGSDHPSHGVFRDTYFNSTYDSYGLERLITIPPNDRDPDSGNGYGKVTALLQALMPEYEIVALIVNDPAYGGSGGQFLVFSVNGSSQEILRHELGHSFGALGDEYGDPFPGYPDFEEPNTTRETNRARIKWRLWIKDTTPVPTLPSDTVDIGLFAGAHYHFTGWYRPRADCRMRTLGTPYCQVCTEALVKSIYGHVSPILSAAPTPGNSVFFDPSHPVGFTVTLAAPSSHPLQVQWFTNHVTVAGATSNLFMLSDPGVSDVAAVAADTTDLVRTDPAGVLRETNAWMLVSPPRVDAVLQDQSLRLFWPVSPGGFVLESSSDPQQGWLGVSVTPTVSSNHYVVPLPATSAKDFFRLRRP